jgi:hypothetical protein
VYLGRDSERRVRHRHARFRGSRRLAERELARMVAEQEARPARRSLCWQSPWRARRRRRLSLMSMAAAHRLAVSLTDRKPDDSRLATNYVSTEKVGLR